MEPIERKPGTSGISICYVGVKDMCRLFGKCRVTIYAMIADGSLPPPLKDKRLNLWNKKEVMSWLQNAKFCR